MANDRRGSAAATIDHRAARPAPETPGQIGPGDWVRQYEIIRELGRGGGGRVLLARDTQLGRRVAMKFLAIESGESTARFLVEARTTAALNHENIVVIHEFGEIRGAPYMVLEYLEGSMLRRLFDGSPMPSGRVIEFALPIVRALVRAHDSGIVHCDLKPENVFVTDSGNVKVLDFGIAKMLSDGRQSITARKHDVVDLEASATTSGQLIGTPRYMSPEQFGADKIDHRTDLWALGIMLFEMAAGKHPLFPKPADKPGMRVGNLNEPMPPIASVVPDLPERLAYVVDRCLQKRKHERFASAREVLAELEPLAPGRHRSALNDQESPYPGLVAFEEGDSGRFFGRDQDVRRTVARVRDLPLVGIVGPSGVGKSSLVRAGVVPALKASGERWDVHVLRPGRSPLAILAALIVHPLHTGGAASSEHHAVVARLAREPGYFGAALRERAAARRCRILLFIDQLEELYTHAHPTERLAYTACLISAADDTSSAVRIVVAMRSDFLDRAGEDPRFLTDLTRGIVFLQPLGPAALRDALIEPLQESGYRFEAPEQVDAMLKELASTRGPMPLLQFAASKLWESRDRGRKLLLRAGYDAMGGISGALAAHADQVLGTLAPAAQRHARAVLLRLVTPERTRAVVDVRELHELAAHPQAIKDVVDHLVAARLLVQTASADASASVELVHESLVSSWHTLRRWLDESEEDAAQLAQLRTAATQWEQKGRDPGLLWRGEAFAEARRWHARYRGELTARERAFLAAVFVLGTRAKRAKRAMVIGVIAVLSFTLMGGAVSLVQIRNAELAAKAEQARAEGERARATAEAARAREAESRARENLKQAQEEQKAKEDAQAAEKLKGDEVKMTQAELKRALEKAERERAVALDQAARARAAELAEQRARQKSEQLLRDERARRQVAEKQRAKITTELEK
jgi:eukaryotic-like serine/threonine-protein kinase